MLGGLSVYQWFSVFSDTHAPNGMGAFVRMEWPEPGGYAAQPEVVRMALSEVGVALTKEAKRSSGIV